jgi:hypothetical protein
MIATITSLLPIGDTYNVLHFFRRISSIIISGLEAVETETIPHPHKSFFDWICSNHPEPRFRVDAKMRHEHLSMRCLEILKTSLHFNMANVVTSDPLVLWENFGIDIGSLSPGDSLNVKAPLWSQTDPSVLYSCSALFHHISAVGQLCSTILVELAYFFKHLFPSWTEVVDWPHASRDYESELESVHTLIPVCIDGLMAIAAYVLSVARTKIIMN